MNKSIKVGTRPASGMRLLAAVAMVLALCTTGVRAQDKTQDAAKPMAPPPGSPVVTITVDPVSSPAYAAPATITVTASAIDSGDNAITVTNLLKDGSVIASGMDHAQATVSNLAAGTYTFSSISTNELGRTGTRTQTVTILPGNVPPTVNLTNPANGQTFTAGQVVTLSATAADSDGTVA